jgi:subtilisin family serine protease
MRKLKASLEEVDAVLTVEQAAYLAVLETEVTDAKKNADEKLALVKGFIVRMDASSAILLGAGLQEITLDAVRAFESTDEIVIAAKNDVLELLAKGYTPARLLRLLGAYTSQATYHYNTEFNPRSIVGDNYRDLNEKNYGNNDVIGDDSFHGTHVSGIIAANRQNQLGINGVASQVKIMAVRVVPNGDERDKDVANGIRYAVDNGARIINMSFGKAYSPYKAIVDEAVKYAESKGVLLVHAAGNSSQNNDTAANFPNRKLTKEGRQAVNWLEIGASSAIKGEALPAAFSNYGKFSVDIFAPGVDIYSTTPFNKYGMASGTSMAAPAAAGVAALVLSYNQDLSMAELRSLLVDSGRHYSKLYVNRPGTTDKILFSDLSITGAITDAYESVESLVQPVKSVKY